MTRSRILHNSGGRNSRRLMYRQMKRFNRCLLSAAFLLGCCCGGTFCAYAGVKETFGPYQDKLWYALYGCIGLFVITLIYEIVASRMLREAEREDLEAVQKSIAEAEKKDVGSGLITDSADPFQALLNQASSAESSSRKASAGGPGKETKAKSVPEPKADVQPAGAVSQPAPALQPFNGAATLPVSVAMVGGKITRDPLATPSPDESNNPFRRAIKPAGDDGKAAAGVSKLDIPASKSLDAVVSAKPLELASAPAASGSEAVPAAGAAKSAAEAAAVKAEKPAASAPSGSSAVPGTGAPNSAVPFSGSATVAVKPNSGVAASIAMVTGKPGAPVGAPQPGAPGAKPFNLSNVTKPGAPFAPPRVPASPKPDVPSPSAPAKPAPMSSSGDDPWKKLLGQTGARAGAPQGSSPIKPPAAPAVSGSAPKMGSNPTRSLSEAAGSAPKMGSNPTRSLSGAAGSVPGVPRTPISGGSDDPWKALLGGSGKGLGSKANPAAPSVGQSPGIPLGIKKNDDVILGNK